MAGNPNDRQVVQSPFDKAAPQLHSIVPSSPVHAPSQASGNFTQVGAADAALGQVLAVGAQWGAEQFHENLKEDYVNGQMAQQQGKTLEEVAGSGLFTSHATVSGFKSMQAQTLADKDYAEQHAQITNGAYTQTPDEYRKFQTDRFRTMLTGDEETDRFITKMAVDNNRKLSALQVQKHEEWKVGEGIASHVNLGLSTLGRKDDEDMQIRAEMIFNKGPAIAGGVYSPEATKKAQAQLLAASLMQGDDTYLKIAQKGGATGKEGDPNSKLLGLEKYNFDAGQLSAIEAAKEHFQNKKNNAYSRDYTVGLNAISEDVKSGKITAVQGAEQLEKLTVSLGKELGPMTAHAVTSMLETAGINDPKIQAATVKYATLAQTGTTTAAITKMMGSDPLLAGMNENQKTHLRNVAVSGELGYKAHMRAKAEAALERAERKREHEAELNQQAQSALDRGDISNLTPGLKTRAFGLLEQSIDQMQNALTRSPNTDPNMVRQGKADLLADSVAKYGVVNETWKDTWTSMFLSQGRDGKQSPATTTAFQSFTRLFAKNPELAMQHLAGDDVKLMATIAMDMVRIGVPPDQALQTAQTRIRDNKKIDFSKPWTPPTNFMPTLEAAIKAKAPSFIQAPMERTIFTQEQVEAAASDPQLIRMLGKDVKATMALYENVSQDEALNSALLTSKGKWAPVNGKVFVDSQAQLYQKLNLEAYASDPSSVHTAVNSFIKRNGKGLFGKEYMDTEFMSRLNTDSLSTIVDSAKKVVGTYKDQRVQEFVTGVPKYTATYDEHSGNVTFYPILNNGLRGAPKIIPGKLIGADYRKAQQEEDAAKAARFNADSVTAGTMY